MVIKKSVDNVSVDDAVAQMETPGAHPGELIATTIAGTVPYVSKADSEMVRATFEALDHSSRKFSEGARRHRAEGNKPRSILPDEVKGPVVAKLAR